MLVVVLVVSPWHFIDQFVSLVSHRPPEKSRFQFLMKRERILCPSTSFVYLCFIMTEDELESWNTHYLYGANLSCPVVSLGIFHWGSLKLTMFELLGTFRKKSPVKGT